MDCATKNHKSVLVILHIGLNSYFIAKSLYSKKKQVIENQIVVYFIYKSMGKISVKIRVNLWEKIREIYDKQISPQIYTDTHRNKPQNQPFKP